MIESKIIRFSRLMLGTVQFGMPYGIANRTGQPSYELARDIVALAYDGGVNCLDTAAAYGSSEAVLGKALHELGLSGKISVVSKVPALPEECSSDRAARRFIEDTVHSSLRRLQIDRLDVCLFHRADDAHYMDALLGLRDRGMIGQVGISVDTPGEAIPILSGGTAAALQAPLNLLDKRMERAGVFAAVRRRRVLLFTRSAYLQGLILMPEGDVPQELQPVLPVRRALEQVAAEAGIGMAEMALRYPLSRPEVTSVVVGVEGLEQMRENLSLSAKGGLGPDLIERIEQLVPELPERCIRPSLWPART